VVVTGHGEKAEQLTEAAVMPFSLNKAVLHLLPEKVVPQMLPPALAGTIPNLPAVKEGKTVAVVCSGFSCQPPMEEPRELEKMLRSSL
jgi:uncharacterized protein YyaL (SSP411 family)